MKDFTGKVAVITGAASGIGLSLAKEAARRGMKLALIDINYEGAALAADECAALGSPKAVAIKADVSVYEEVKFSVQRVMNEFGCIDLMINNAGVWPGAGMLELPRQDWEWTISVNALGASYYAMEVLPILRAQGTPCHYMVVSSVAGLTGGGVFGGVYIISKHASVLLAEEIKAYGEENNMDMGVSVFCPSIVATEIANSYKVRPEQFSKPCDPVYATEGYWAGINGFDMFVKSGYNADGVALRLFRAIEDNQMYIVSHPETHEVIRNRFRAIEADMDKELEIYKEFEEFYKNGI